MSTFTLQAGLTLPYYDWLSSGTSITWTTVGQTFVTTDPGEVAELRTRSYLAWDGVVPPTPVVVRSKTVVWDGSNLVAKPNEAGDSPVTLPVVAASQLDTDAAMAANSDARAATQKATKTALGLKLDASNLDLASPTPNAPFVYDSIAGKLVPAAKTITKSSGFAEMRVGYSTGATGWAAVNATRPIHLDNNYQVTDITNPLQNSVQGITSTVQFGTGGSSPVAAMGTVHNFSARFVVAGSGDPQNEHAAYFGYIRYENGSRGRTWFTDWNVHGPVAVQPKRLVGITMFMGNYYNGPPEDTPSAGQWIVTRQGSGGGAAAEHTAATTYSINTGLGIIGHSGAILGNGGAGVGFDKALQIGDGGAWGVLGGQDGSRIGTGIDLSDFLNFG
ncbi:MAG: hypothetical protein REI11_10695, partial [Patulibacter sp.]|nr:hypothetical protein [Patulibacter sp.]